jgi:hypothetical protein
MGVIRRTSKNPESGDFKSSTIFEKNKPTKAVSTLVGLSNAI